MKKLSIALATFNEEENLVQCLESVKNLADEIVIVDGSSIDRTVEIAKKYQAKVFITDNPSNWHINKQKALEKSSGEWILQLDADEKVSSELANEVRRVMEMSQEEIEGYQENLPQKKLFLRHQEILAKRDGEIGERSGEYVAFFVPRLNFFLGKFLKHGGVYPDGVIRLVKKGKAYFPCKNVHEQMAVEGRVGWLKNDLLHLADKSFSRYLKRNSHYIDLLADELKKENVSKGPLQFLNYSLIKPVSWFFLTQIRHKGILDGYQGIIFSFFSALRFPRTYWRYLKKRKND